MPQHPLVLSAPSGSKAMSLGIDPAVSETTPLYLYKTKFPKSATVPDEVYMLVLLCLALHLVEGVQKKLTKV